MAWNPSKEVQVARDAAAKLGECAGSRVAQVVILYITDDSRLGLVTYGRDKRLCEQAKQLGDSLHRAAIEVL